MRAFYSYKKFSSGEINVDIHANLVAKKILIWHAFSNAIHDEIISLLLLLKRCKQAKEIILFLPYLPYSRTNDIEILCEILYAAGVNEIITVEIHERVPGVSNVKIFSDIIKQMNWNMSGVVIISPDKGRYEAAKSLSAEFQCEVMCCEKIRQNNSSITHLKGDVKDKDILIIDDIIDSGQTILSTYNTIINKGGRSVTALCIHGILSGNARNILMHIERIYISNTLLQWNLPSNFECIDVSELLLSKLPQHDVILKNH